MAATTTHESLASDDEQRAVENVVARSAIIGAIVGAVICALIWVGLMAIAMAGKGWSLGPMLLVGAGCGLFAGIFLGGWAGTLVGALKLEHHEHQSLPKR
jgi:protein-S-isoprenylcysteine O-methyltransferase Ste14